MISERMDVWICVCNLTLSTEGKFMLATRIEHIEYQIGHLSDLEAVHPYILSRAKWKHSNTEMTVIIWDHGFWGRKEVQGLCCHFHNLIPIKEKK